MTGPVPTGDAQPQMGSTDPGGQGQTGGLYDQYLSDIPAQFHPQVTKAFQTFDGNVTRKFQDIQARYSPYQELIESYQPQRLAGGVSLLDYLEADPASTIAELAQFYGIEPAQGGPGAGGTSQPVPQQQTPDQGFQLPQEYQQRFDQHDQLLNLIVQNMIEQRDQQQLEAEATQFDQYLASEMSQAGLDPDDRDALAHILSIISAREVHPSEAIASYQSFLQRVTGQANGASAPWVMPSGGGLPSQQVDPRTLDRKSTQALVQSLIARDQQT